MHLLRKCFVVQFIPRKVTVVVGWLLYKHCPDSIRGRQVLGHWHWANPTNSWRCASADVCDGDHVWVAVCDGDHVWVAVCDGDHVWVAVCDGDHVWVAVCDGDLIWVAMYGWLCVMVIMYGWKCVWWWSCMGGCVIVTMYGWLCVWWWPCIDTSCVQAVYVCATLPFRWQHWQKKERKEEETFECHKLNCDVFGCILLYFSQYFSGCSFWVSPAHVFIWVSPAHANQAGTITLLGQLEKL